MATADPASNRGREWWDREYSPTRTVPDAADHLAGYRTRGSAARRRAADRRLVAFGPTPAEQLEVLSPGSDGPGPAVVFVHGGGWDSLTREDSAFLAPALLDRGVSTVVVDYPHAPGYSLERIAATVSRALEQIVAAAPRRLGIDLSRTVVVATSAGAHLVAQVLESVTGIAGAVLCSGIYDLDPLRRTYYADLLSLDLDRVERCSPARTGGRPGVEVVLAVGADEGEEFRRQTRLMDEHLRGVGAGVTTHVVPGRHHFDLPDDATDPQTAVGRDVARLTRTRDQEPT